METKGNGHKSNWLVILKNHLEDVKGPGWVDENLVSIKAAIAAVALEATLGTHDTDIKALLNTIAGYIDTEIAAIETKLDTPANFMADVSALALEDTLTAIKGAGWTTETLKAIKDAIDAIAGVDTYQEQIPDTDFSLNAIDDTLASDPPNADAENSVVDIDAEAGSTFVLRSLWVSVTSFGTGTKLTFKLWVPVNGAITNVDSVDISAIGIQNMVDIFGLQEIHADSIYITVQTDTGSTGACEGSYRYAKAS